MKKVIYLLGACLASLYSYSQTSVISGQTIQNKQLSAKQFELIELSIPFSSISANINQGIQTFLADQDRHYLGYDGINPFNPKDISVEFKIDNKNTIHGFYYCDFNYIDINGNIVQQNSPNTYSWKPVDGSEEFRVRWAPKEVGVHSITLLVGVKDPGSGTLLYQSILLPFETVNVTESSSSGFVHADDRNYFVRYDGVTKEDEVIMPIAMAIGWTSHSYARLTPYNSNQWWKGYPLQKAHEYMTDFSNEGVDLFRILMTNWNYNIEQYRLNDYSENQHNAWELDKLFKTAENLGVLIQLDIEHATMTLAPGEPCSSGVIKQWEWSPYNVNGTACQIPAGEKSPVAIDLQRAQKDGPIPELNIDQFFTNVTAKEMMRRKLRYIVARWGYSTSLAFYEIMNEIDIYYDPMIINDNDNLVYAPGWGNGGRGRYHYDPTFRQQVDNWCQDMSTSVHEYDKYYDREIGVSIGYNSVSDILGYSIYTPSQRAELSMANTHSYGLNMNQLENKYRAGVTTRLAHNLPAFVNEAGAENFVDESNNDSCLANRTTDACDAMGIRKAMWYTFYSGTLIGNSQWNWTEIEKNGTYISTFIGLSRFKNHIKVGDQAFKLTALNFSEILKNKDDGTTPFSTNYPINSQLPAKEFNILGLVNPNNNFFTFYVNNKTAYWENVDACWSNPLYRYGSCVDPSTTHHSNSWIPFNNTTKGSFSINNLKPNRDYYIEYYNPTTGLVISGTGANMPKFVSTDANGTLNIAFELTPFDGQGIDDGSDIAIIGEICTNRFPAECGYDEWYLNYYNRELLNSRSFDIVQDKLFYLDHNSDFHQVDLSQQNPSDIILSNITYHKANTEILSNTDYTFYIGTDGKVWNINNSNQQVTQISSAESSDGTALALNASGEKVFYRQLNGDVWCTFKTGATSWASNAVNSNAPDAHQNTSLYWTSAGKVLYITESNELYEYYWTGSTWNYRKPVQGLPLVRDAKFGFEAGKISYVNMSGNIVRLGWNGSAWTWNSISPQNPVDQDSDIEIINGIIYFFSDGKLISLAWNSSSEELLDFCAVRANDRSKIIPHQTEFFYANLEPRIGIYNYLGQCKTDNGIAQENYDSKSINNDIDIVIYPNPANQSISISGATINGESNFKVEILNMTGQLLKVVDNYQMDSTIDISSLSAGTYHIRMYNSSDSKSSSFVVTSRK